MRQILKDLESVYFLSTVKGGELFIAPLGADPMNTDMWIRIGVVHTDSTPPDQPDPQ